MPNNDCDIVIYDLAGALTKALGVIVDSGIHTENYKEIGEEILLTVNRHYGAINAARHSVLGES